MGICGDKDGDKYSPMTGNGDGEYFGRRGAEKLPLLIPRPIDILLAFYCVHIFKMLPNMKLLPMLCLILFFYVFVMGTSLHDANQLVASWQMLY
jgi:hypothetical protein